MNRRRLENKAVIYTFLPTYVRAPPLPSVFQQKYGRVQGRSCHQDALYRRMLVVFKTGPRRAEPSCFPMMSVRNVQKISSKSKPSSVRRAKRPKQQHWRREPSRLAQAGAGPRAARQTLKNTPGYEVQQQIVARSENNPFSCASFQTPTSLSWAPNNKNLERNIDTISTINKG